MKSNGSRPRLGRRGGVAALALGAVLLAGCSADEGPTMVVTAPATPAPTVTITATPSTVSTGSASTLTWSSTGATACTASGAWTGTKDVNGTQSITASSSPGSYAYTLTCSAADGQQASSTASLTVSPNAVPTVSISATPSTVVAGSTTTLNWSSTGASSCTASSAWTGSKGTSGSETVTTSTVAGSYSYTLTCAATDGQQASATAAVTVTPSTSPTPSADCDQTQNLTSITGSKAVATSSTTALCLVCSVTDAAKVVDTDPLTFGTITTTVGLLNGTGTIDVMNTATVYPAGLVVGYKIAAPSGVLSVGLISNLSLTTQLAGVTQETSTIASNTLALTLLNMTISGALPGVVSFKTTKPFDSVAITYGAVLPVAPTLQVYQACVTLQ